MTNRHPQITNSHLERRFIDYIRVSSEQQVRHSVGSTGVQRDFVAQALALGWPKELIEVIDEDLGVTASAGGLRSGFSRLIAEMKTGTVGAVGTTDISRLLRNFRDLAEFAEAAECHDVLLIHGTQITDFRDPNSAFVGGLLGLNGNRENRARAEFARTSRRKKAEQGIATTRPRRGYVAHRDGTRSKTDDLRIRESIQALFDNFWELGTAGRVLRYMRQCRMLLPGRSGTWLPPTRQAIIEILRAEEYAGTLVFGRTAVEPGAPRDRKGRLRPTPQPPAKWIRRENRHEGYVSLPRWHEIQARLSANRKKLVIPAGRGDALVQGLLRCTVHQKALRTTGTARGRREPRRQYKVYSCDPRDATGETKLCCFASARAVDRVIEAELFRVMAAPPLHEIEKAAREARREYESQVRLRQIEIQRADQAVAERERAYDQADNDPYLKRRLGERFSEALCQRDELRAQHALHPLEPPIRLDARELDEIRDSVTDVPVVWRHPTITAEEKKMLVRALISTIEVTPQPSKWTFGIRWNGTILGADGLPAPDDTTLVELLTHDAIRREIALAYSNSIPASEIVADLERRRVVKRRGPRVGEPLTAADVRRVIVQDGLQDAHDGNAYVQIAGMANDRLPTWKIAHHLNSQGILHSLGAWTRARVEAAMSRLRAGRVPGIVLPRRTSLVPRIEALYKSGTSEPISILERLRGEALRLRNGGPVTLSAVYSALKRLGLPVQSRTTEEELVARLTEWAPTLSTREITRRVSGLGLLTRYGLPWTANGMSRKLATLGLRVSKPRLGRRKKGRPA